jgi:hypothetical protein
MDLSCGWIDLEGLSGLFPGDEEIKNGALLGTKVCQNK